jgi:hypothetical protein
MVMVASSHDTPPGASTERAQVGATGIFMKRAESPHPRVKDPVYLPLAAAVV